LLHHPHRTVAKLRRKLVPCSTHCGSFSQIGASGKPGTLQPDKASNMLVLCPNHHLQFDRGIIFVRKVQQTFRVFSLVPNDPIHDRELELTHPLDEEFVDYHRQWHSKPRD
ncbi:MAG: HNH endonuclease, partial [Erythrobacter sp.]|nr:HNH endonuclease [Erythrobacter sp.]